MRKSYPLLVSEEPPPPKRGRSSEDFLMFCKMILDYENYDDSSSSSDDIRLRHTSSPMGSTASVSESSLSSFTDDATDNTIDTTVPGATGHINTSDEDTVTDDLEDMDDTEEITCYCRKPYGGRPMIECTSCQTWVHLTCARVKRTQIPDIWYCALCKTKSTKSGSNKSRARKSLQRRKQSSLSPPSTTIPAVSTMSLFKSKRKL